MAKTKQKLNWEMLAGKGTEKLFLRDLIWILTSLGHFIKHNPLIYEECHGTNVIINSAKKSLKWKIVLMPSKKKVLMSWKKVDIGNLLHLVLKNETGRYGFLCM